MKSFTSLESLLQELGCGSRSDLILLNSALVTDPCRDLLDKLRERSPGVSVIVMMDVADEALAGQLLASGVRDYLVKKHWTADELRRCVRHCAARTQMERQQRELEKLAIQAGRRERSRTVRELHDGVGQQLTGLNLLASSLQRRLEQRQAPETELAATIVSVIRDTAEELRAVLSGLMPVSESPEGLRKSLERLCQMVSQRTRVECRLDFEPNLHVKDNLRANHLFRIAQEAVNNAIKHSGASVVEVSLRRVAGCVELRVIDDGCGFDMAQAASKGLGLRLMHHRCRLSRGTLSIQSPLRDGRGCQVCCLIPED